MAVDVVTEVVVSRPVDVVAEFAGDPTNAPRWYSRISTVEWRTPPPLRLGTQLDFVAHFLGRRLAYTYEVVVLEPGRRLVMRTADGPFPMETTYEWTAVGDDATRMVLRNRGEPSGFSQVTAPVLARAIRRANRQDLDALRALLEAPAPGR